MAISFPTTGDSLVRTTGLLQPTTDFTVAFWGQFGTANTSSQQIFLVYGPVATGLHDYWEIASRPYNDNTQLEASSATTMMRTVGPTLPVLTWAYFAATYDHTAHVWTFYVNGAALGTFTNDLSAVTFTSVTVANNASYGAQPGIGMQYYREWQAVLTGTQIAAEMGSATVVTTANLWTDTPLSSATDLADLSGHGHSWTVVGNPTTVAPPSLTGGSAAQWIPQPHPLIDPTTGNRVTTPWYLYFQHLTAQGAGAAQAGSTVSTVLTTDPMTSTGGPTPILGLAPSGVTPGTYTNATLTVNQYGIITAAAPGVVAGSWVPLSLGVEQDYSDYVVVDTPPWPQSQVFVSDGAGHTIFVAFS
jgi:hypothetical protein